MRRRVFFFLSGSPPIQNKSPNQFFVGPMIGSQLEPLKTTFMFFRLKVLKVQILKIEDLPGMSSSSNMPFHNSAPKFVH